jgi:hypothetical protein
VPAPAPTAVEAIEPAAPEPEPVESAVAEPVRAGAAGDGLTDVERDTEVTALPAPVPVPEYEPAPAPGPVPEQMSRPEPAPEHEQMPDSIELIELPGAQVAAATAPAGEAHSNGSATASHNGDGPADGPAIELVPAAGMAVPEVLSGAPADADEKYLVAISELTLSNLPDTPTGEPPDPTRPHRDPRADAAGDTIAGEEVITTLVDELANRATTLKSAWEEHRAKSGE